MVTRGGLILLLLLLPAGRVHAAPSCADAGRKQDSYQAGRAQGHKLVESAWAVLGEDCGERDHLEETVLGALERLTPPAGSSDSVLCRYQGLEDGASEELVEIATACQGS